MHHTHFADGASEAQRGEIGFFKVSGINQVSSFWCLVELEDNTFEFNLTEDSDSGSLTGMASFSSQSWLRKEQFCQPGKHFVCHSLIAFSLATNAHGLG